MDSLSEKIKEWNDWLENVNNLSLSQLKQGAEYWGKMAESQNTKESDETDTKFISHIAKGMFFNDFAFMAYRRYSERLEKELSKNQS